MGSKRNKKSKQDAEMFSGSNNEDDCTTEPEINDSEIENNGINQSTKRKRKHEDTPKKSKKSHKIDGESKKKARKSKIKDEPSDGPEVYPENEESDIDGEVKIEICENPVKVEDKDDSPDKKKDEITWPENDLMELITRMELNIPERDTLAFSTRAEKLNWDSVAFNDYTSHDCKKMWGLVQKRIRRFRLLSEVLTDARCWIINPKAKHRTVGRVRKHPDMPRRPLSSYLLFYLKARDRIISENPDLEGSDITKYMGQVYKSLPPDQREQYEREAASNKEEYHEKLRVFFENHPEMAPSPKVSPKMEKEKPVKVEKEKSKPEKKEKPRPEVAAPSKPEKSSKAEKDRPRPEKEKTRPGPGRPPKNDKDRREKLKAPKRCQTAFGLYHESELKSADEGIDKLAFKEKCKEDWKQFTDKKKLHWINLAEQDLLRYNDEIKKYKVINPESQVHEMKSNLTKEERQIKQLSSGKPIKPPNSAYGLYSKILLQSEEIKVVHPKDRMNFIANKWKNATEELRNSLRDKTLTMMEKYKLEYATYLESLPEDKRILEVPIKQKLKRGPKPGSKRKPRSRKPARNETKTAPTKTKFKEPEQPPISPAKYFASLYKGEGDAIQAWKALTTDEKHRYEEELTKKKQAYIVEFEKFLKSLTKEELEAFSKSRQQRAKSDEESSECSSDSGNEDADDENDDEIEGSGSGTE